MAAPRPESDFTNCQYCKKAFRARGIKSHERCCPERTRVDDTPIGNADPTVVGSTSSSALQTLIDNDRRSGMLHISYTSLHLTHHDSVDTGTRALLTAIGIPTDTTTPPLPRGTMNHSHKNKFMLIILYQITIARLTIIMMPLKGHYLIFLWQIQKADQTVCLSLRSTTSKLNITRVLRTYHLRCSISEGHFTCGVWNTGEQSCSLTTVVAKTFAGSKCAERIDQAIVKRLSE